MKEDISSIPTITDKNGEWEFKVWYTPYINYSSLVEHDKYEIVALENSGNKILDKKPLTVGGFPAIMISSLNFFILKIKVILEKYIELLMMYIIQSRFSKIVIKL